MDSPLITNKPPLVMIFGVMDSGRPFLLLQALWKDQLISLLFWWYHVCQTRLYGDRVFHRPQETFMLCSPGKWISCGVDLWTISPGPGYPCTHFLSPISKWQNHRTPSLYAWLLINSAKSVKVTNQTKTTLNMVNEKKNMFLNERPTRIQQVNKPSVYVRKENICIGVL